MKRFHWSWILALVLSVISAFGLSASNTSAYTSSASAQMVASLHTAKFWLQTMDSCRQAIPGASFVLKGNGLRIHKGPGPGSRRQGVGPGSCPIQRGDCSAVHTGCLSWNIPIPSSGSRTYKITETEAPDNYVPCTGGSVCPGGPVVVTLRINSAGRISATVRNVYPDGTVVVWPTSGRPYTGKLTDPAVVHNFELGSLSCDGDRDADDHLTGTSPGSHCDSDGDRNH